jgi:sugar phosphate permease
MAGSATIDRPNVDPSAGVPRSFEDATYRKVSWRLIPFLLLCYVVAYLDRVNVGFAKLQMLTDLKFSETVYGFGAGIFFVGYFIFEVPSNVILHRMGARVWIARIMITWGAISALMMFVSTPLMFYVVRFFLGAAEAGFFPGIILYLTYWYPAERRGRVTATFMTAVALSGVIGGPVSGYILKNLGGVYGWAGWQWLFLIEGIPSVLIGIAVLFILDDRILHAKWLSDSEKALLQRNIDAEAKHKVDVPLAKALASGRVWLMGLIYFSFVMGLYGVSFWLPTIIKAMGVKDVLDVSLLTAIPYAFAAVTMVLVGRNADRMRERRWHIAISGFLGALGFVMSVVWHSDTLLAMGALTLATMGILSALPLFWSLPTAFLVGTGAAGAIALINSLGNLAGFASPYAVGWLKDLTQSTDAGMYMLAVSMVVGSLLTLSVPARAVKG